MLLIRELLVLLLQAVLSNARLFALSQQLEQQKRDAESAIAALRAESVARERELESITSAKLEQAAVQRVAEAARVAEKHALELAEARSSALREAADLSRSEALQNLLTNPNASLFAAQARLQESERQRLAALLESQVRLC